MNIEKDNYGRPYALIKDVKDGDMLEADGGFVCDAEPEEGDQPPFTDDEGNTYCIKPHSRVVVRSEDGRLYVNCTHGTHMLDGQEEDLEETVEPFYMGLYPLRD